jgi:hypothetical protein
MIKIICHRWEFPDFKLLNKKMNDETSNACISDEVTKTNIFSISFYKGKNEGERICRKKLSDKKF